MASLADVGPFYQGVIDEVIKNLRRTFIEEGYDENVLESLKTKWTRRLCQRNIIPAANQSEPAPSSSAYAQMYQARKLREEIRQQQQQPKTSTAFSYHDNKHVLKQDFIIRDNESHVEMQSIATQQAFSSLPSQHQQRLVATTSDSFHPLVSQRSDGQNYPLSNHNIVQQVGAASSSNNSKNNQGPNIQLPQLDGVGDDSDSSSDSDDDDDFISPSVDDRNRAVLTTPKSDLFMTPTLASNIKRKKTDGFSAVSGTAKRNKTGAGSESGTDSEGMDDLDLGDGIMEESLMLSGCSDDGVSGDEGKQLNSEDDITDEDTGDMFDCKNVVICQFDKVNRLRNKWRFYLKDGIMDIDGKDYIFQKATGEANW